MNTIKEKVEKVRELVDSSNLTAYRISQSVSPSVTTISAILNGTNTNPRDETLNEILIFLAKSDKSLTPKRVHFEDIEKLINENIIMTLDENIVPKLDAIIRFIEFVYPNYIDKHINKEKGNLNKKTEIIP